MNKANRIVSKVTRHDGRVTTFIMLALAWWMLSERTVLADDEEPRQRSSPQAASNEAELHIGKLRVGKILFLGNSITLHSPAPQIGWHGNWGMAASIREKDYVHLLLDKIAKSAGGMPKVMVKNIADFERGLQKYEIQKGSQESYRQYLCSMFLV